MMRIFILIVTCLLLQTTSLFAQTPNDYKIYERVIKDALESRFKKIRKSKVISIIDTTQNISENDSWVVDDFNYFLFSNPLNESELKKCKALTASLISDATPQKIEPDSLNLRLKTQTLSKEQMELYFQKSPSEGWKKYYRANRKSAGIITLSPVHYKDQLAVVYLTYSYNGLGSRGDVYFLEFKNNEWTIKSAFNLFKS